MSQAVASTPPSMVALRPLGGLVGRSVHMSRLLAHVDAGRSVRLTGDRGAGTTAVLRAVCGEPLRPSVSDGVLALPAGIPLLDLPHVAHRVTDGNQTPGVSVDQRRLLLMLDDRDLEPSDVATVLRQFPHSVLVVVGPAGSTQTDLEVVALEGLSDHHAVGLMEAAVGRPLTLDEGRAARWVAAAVRGLPVPLVQAAAAVRDGGLSFSEIRDLLDDPPRPGALTLALHHALDDHLHVTLSTLRSLGDVPAPTPVLAAAADVTPEEVLRRMRRLALLGLVTTDGRDGWSAAVGIAEVSESLRADTARRLTEWVAGTSALDIFATASLLAVVGGRVQSSDHGNAGALAAACLTHLPLEGLDQTTLLLEQTVAWADAARPRQPAAVMATKDVADPVPEPATSDMPAEAAAAGTSTRPVPPDPSPPPTHDPHAADQLEPDSSSGVAAFVSDWRRLAAVAVAAAAVLAAVLVVVPMLQRSGPPPDLAPVAANLDLGTASVGEPRSATLQLDLTGRDAAPPIRLSVTGPDADAFTLSPRRCDTDCRSSVTFTADRSGAHLGTVTATDADGTEQAVVSLTGDGTADPPSAAARTNLAVTVFPSRPTPLPRGGSGVVPIGVTNNGPDASTGSELVVTLPAGVTGSAPGCTARGTTLTCALGELAVAEGTQVAVTVRVPDDAAPLRVLAEVAPTTDTDPSGGDDAAGFTFPVR